MFPSNIFLIPGNPPALHFYKLWRDEILAVQPEAQIFIGPFPILELRQSSVDYFRAFAHELEGRFLDWQKSVTGPVALIGHSVGGYFALEILKRQHSLVEECALLFPFLKAPTRRGRSILKIVQTLQGWSRFEPLALRLHPWLSKVHGDLAKVEKTEVRACLRLAFHEQQVISRDQSALEIAPALREKLLLLYGDNDTWCPQSLIETLKTQVRSHQRVGASHAFIMYPDERAELYRALESLSSQRVALATMKAEGLVVDAPAIASVGDDTEATQLTKHKSRMVDQ